MLAEDPQLESIVYLFNKNNMISLSVQKEFKSVQISQIISKVNIRSVKTNGVDRLKTKIQRLGYQDSFPVTLYKRENGYRLIDGNHRLEACVELGLSEIPALIIEQPKTDLEEIKLARESNEASETVVPTTFVDDAELIWRMLEKNTQEEVGKTLGWSRAKVKDYNSLSKISTKTWRLIGATFNNNRTNEEDTDAPDNGATAPDIFTENLLRSIVNLNPRQQYELVSNLVNDKEKNFNKAKFKTLAIQYKANNEIFNYVLSSIGKIPLGTKETKFRKKLMLEIYNETYEKNKYSKDWINLKKLNEENKKKGKDLIKSTEAVDKLIQYINDRINDLQSITLVNGDFNEKVKEIGDKTIDLIVTDPPYNIARDRVIDYDNRSEVSYDFGEWDKVEKTEFITSLQLWAKEWYRIAKDTASIYVFMSDRYFSYARDALEDAGWNIKNPMVWCKSNPGTTPVTSDRKSSFELILFAVKESGKHTFNQLPNNDKQCLNYTIKGICQGNERIKLDKNGTTHPTQKPESLITELIESSSNKNDLIFDGFMGVGTTLAVAKKLGRKAIGIELDKTYYEFACDRLKK